VALAIPFHVIPESAQRLSGIYRHGVGGLAAERPRFILKIRRV